MTSLIGRKPDLGGEGGLTSPPGAQGNSPEGEAGAPSRRRRLPLAGVPLIPALVLLSVFLLGPVIWSFYGSLTTASLKGLAAREPRFVGFDNYIMLFSSPEFANSLLLTLIFVIGSAVIGQNTLGLALALMMENSNRTIRNAASTAVMASWMLPEVVAAFACYAYFSGEGTLNQIAAFFGIPPYDWLYSAPMLAVILANVWRGTAFSLMVYSAALKNVPTEISEAARVDGANPAQRLFLVTLPMISKSIATNLMLITLQTLSVFGLIWIMTKGGPNGRSATLPIFAYEQAMQFSMIGYGTAIATVLLVIGALFSVLYIRVLKPEVNS